MYWQQMKRIEKKINEEYKDKVVGCEAARPILWLSAVLTAESVRPAPVPPPAAPHRTPLRREHDSLLVSAAYEKY